VCVIEMSGTSWLVAATVPGIDRRPLQKLPVNPARLLEQVERWRKEAARADRTITRTVVAYDSVLHGCAGWRRRRSVSMLRISPSCRTNTTPTVATTLRGRSDA
jgi:hypothetical protein